MSAQGTSTTLGWGFYPAGDIYSLTPKWEELHACTGSTCKCSDPENSTLHICLADGVDWGLTLDLVDLGTNVDSALDDAPPTTFTRADVRIWRNFGWSIPQDSIGVSPISLDGQPGVWSGSVTVSIPAANHQRFELNTEYHYSIDVWIGDTGIPFPVRVMMGTIVRRR